MKKLITLVLALVCVLGLVLSLIHIYSATSPVRVELICGSGLPSVWETSNTDTTVSYTHLDVYKRQVNVSLRNEHRAIPHRKRCQKPPSVIK